MNRFWKNGGAIIRNERASSPEGTCDLKTDAQLGSWLNKWFTKSGFVDRVDVSKANSIWKEEKGSGILQTRINETVFSYDDTDWVTFYNEHGWVVVENFLHDSLRSDSLTQWNELKNDCAIEMGMSLDEYQLEVSQWRDLWTNGGTFHQLIFEPIFHSLAQIGMGWNGSRLLHDHIICKPHQGSNKKIPWHQDSMFWPVDTHGCSTWTALRDVTISDGCLEVIDRSHLEGCENPVDFMAKERESFPEGSIRVSFLFEQAQPFSSIA